MDYMRVLGRGVMVALAIAIASGRAAGQEIVLKPGVPEGVQGGYVSTGNGWAGDAPSPIEAFDHQYAHTPRAKRAALAKPVGWTVEGFRLRQAMQLWHRADVASDWDAIPVTERSRLRRLLQLGRFRENPVAAIADANAVYFACCASDDGDDVRVGKVPLGAKLDSHKRDAVAELLTSNADAFTDIYFDDKACSALGVRCDGHRTNFGVPDAHPIFGHVYVAARDAAPEILSMATRRVPEGRLAVYLESDAPGWMSKISNISWVYGKKRPQTRDALLQLVRSHPGTLIMLVGHVGDDQIAVGPHMVAMHELEAAASKNESVLLVLGCNSARGGTGILGQVQAHPLLERVATALRGTTVREVLEPLGTARNPLFLGTATIEGVGRLVHAASKDSVSPDEMTDTNANIHVTVNAIFGGDGSDSGGSGSRFVIRVQVAADPEWHGWLRRGALVLATGAFALLIWKRRAILTHVWRRWMKTAGPTAQFWAVKYLAAVGGPVAVKIITEHLPEMPVEHARRVFEWLANRGTPTAREVLLGQLGDPVLGPHAARALDRTDPSWRAAPDAVALALRLSAQLASAEKPRESNRAIGALGRLRAAAAVPAILAALGDRDLIWTAQHALTEIGRPAITQLLELLAEQGDERRDVAWRSVTGIAGWNTTPEARAALPTLLAGLGHRYSLIRERCVMALGQIGDSCAYHLLIAALDDIKDRVRIAAVDALRHLGHKRPGSPGSTGAT
jgi:HEAT repeats